MEELQIKLTQLDKTNFPLNKVHEEISFMYNSTVASASKRDLEFFVLIFFLFLRIKDKSVLFIILDKYLENLIRLSYELRNFKRNLVKHEYTVKKEELGLSDVLKYDVIFLLLNAIYRRNSYKEYLDSYPDLSNEMDKITERFGTKVIDFIHTFPTSRIEDNRYDDEGNHLDLSKSVYKTVGMRLSKTINISLQQFTHVNEIKSHSPIDLTLVQQISPELFFLLWDKFHLAEYALLVFPNINYISDIGDFILKHTSFDVNIADIIQLLIAEKVGQRRAMKKATSATLEAKKRELNKTKQMNSLLQSLVTSILNSSEKLNSEILKREKELKPLLDKKNLTKKEKANKAKLQLEIKKLKNIKITVKRSK